MGVTAATAASKRNRPCNTLTNPTAGQKTRVSNMYHISCHCGAGAESVAIARGNHSAGVDLSLCHCDSCRHASGVLCTSYYPIESRPVSFHKLSSYESTGIDFRLTRYFCSVCGCHLFRSKTDSSGVVQWEVATGVVVSNTPAESVNAQYKKHINVLDAVDGGISVWMPEIAGRRMVMDATQANNAEMSAGSRPDDERLQASCLCGKIKFHITRPGQESYQPRSGFSDLIHPFYSTDKAIVVNPGDEKWWIRDKGTKYLAGTCVCRSCRLISGFEIQTWAFVPRRNIHFHTLQEDSSEVHVPLHFDTLPAGLLQNYASSPGVRREFCGGCGATVFWHDEHRPELVDVSVGLLRAPEGARAEKWLDWWTTRVSFAEDIERGREGLAAKPAVDLLRGLESGMDSWNQSKH